MAVLDGIGIVVLVCGLGLAVLALRRRILTRSGAGVEMSLRRAGQRGTRGWAYGVARYAPERLEWFRVFSYSPRPRRTIRRQGLHVRSQRRPVGHESLSVVTNAVVFCCDGPDGAVEIALPEQEVTGFLAWLEGGPPDPRNFVR